MSNRAGYYKTIPLVIETDDNDLGYRHYIKTDETYECFMPTPLAEIPSLAIDYTIIDLLVKAHRRLAILDNTLKKVKPVILSYDCESENDCELTSLQKKLAYYDKDIEYYTYKYGYPSDDKDDSNMDVNLPHLDISYSDDVNTYKQLLHDRAKCNKQILGLEKKYAPVAYADAFIYMLNQKEALSSFQIAGSTTPIIKVLYPKFEEPYNYNNDFDSIAQYARTLDNYTYKKQALNCDYLSQLHSLVLCAQKRAELIARDNPLNTDPFSILPPTAFRDTQNWLDKEKRVKLNLAEYVTPEPNAIYNLMTDLESYIDGSGNYDTLIRAALIHYQLATIRPFDTGNGIVNRLLTPLYLTQKGILTKPSLCLSHYLNKNQKAYFRSLDEVRKSGDYEQWIRFFLKILAEAAKETNEILHELFSLRQGNTIRIEAICKGTLDNAEKLFYYLEEHPYFDIKTAAVALNLDFRKINNDAVKFCECNILSTDGSRNRIFIYEDYLKIIFGSDEDFMPQKNVKNLRKKARDLKLLDSINSIDFLFNK